MSNPKEASLAELSAVFMGIMAKVQTPRDLPGVFDELKALQRRNLEVYLDMRPEQRRRLRQGRA